MVSSSSLMRAEETGSLDRVSLFPRVLLLLISLLAWLGILFPCILFLLRSMEAPMASSIKVCRRATLPPRSRSTARSLHT